MMHVDHPFHIVARRPAAIPAQFALLLTTIFLLCFGISTSNFFAERALLLETLRLAILFACARLLAAYGFHRISTFFCALALIVGFSGAVSLLSMIFATTALPYADAALAGADAWLLGGDYAADLLRLERRHPILMVALSVVYQTLNIQPLLLILHLSWTGRTSELARFVHAWAIALLMTVLIFPFVPAAGFYIHHGIEASALPGLAVPAAWGHFETLSAVRAGGMRAIDGQVFHGIITFPSFHAAGAVLLGWGFRHDPLLRWPMALLNAAMMLSAIPIGGHYVVDLIGGTVVAVVAIRLSRNVATARHPADASSLSIIPRSAMVALTTAGHGGFPGGRAWHPRN